MKRQREKVLVGMSGGVDSSVTAALLCAQGYEVIGCSISLVTCHRAGSRSCCTARDRMDARKVCEQLAIPHVVVDGVECFRREVIDPFVEDYLSGRTPSPCIRCNAFVKFPLLLSEADRLGARFIATGHYARIVQHDTEIRLACAQEMKKDQSYFLFAISRETLPRLVLPLGTMPKSEVREVAAAQGLVVSKKPESQEICFVPEDDYVAFLEERAGPRLPGAGSFVDRQGKKLGTHRGFHAYTIGQRRGLNVAAGKRIYVTAIDPQQNVVTLGDDDDLLRSELTTCGTTWLTSNPDREEVVVRIRSTHAGVPARLTKLSDDRVQVVFQEPVRAVAPGQAAVFYRDGEVLGGGWIV